MAGSAGRPAVTGCRNSTAIWDASQLDPPLPIANSRPPPRSAAATTAPAPTRASPTAAKKRALVSRDSAAFAASECSNAASSARLLRPAVQERIEALEDRVVRHGHLEPAGERRIASISACASPSSVRSSSVSASSLVDAAHGKADMHQHPVADAGVDRMLLVDDAGDVHLAPDAADIDRRELLPASSIFTIRPGMPRHMMHFRPLIVLASSSCAPPTAACPSASPPSLAGTAHGSARRIRRFEPARNRLEQDAVLEQPPDSATVAKREPSSSSRREACPPWHDSLGQAAVEARRHHGAGVSRIRSPRSACHMASGSI